MKGQIRLTEQGEVIAAKYANPEIGRRNLETLVAATLEATLLHADAERAARPSWTPPTRDRRASMAAYRKLVYETPGFTDYFFAATPIREIAELNIGSRPASRKATRAHRGPARHSVGLQLGPEPRGAARLVRLRHGHRRVPGRCGDRASSGWRCCSACTAVAVLPHAAVQPGHGAGQERPAHRRALRRTGRGQDAAAGASSAPSAGEWERTNAALSLITGESKRLPSNPTLARSIEHRFPYLDPLNHLQVELMRRFRRPGADAADAAEQRLRRGIHISINGIAAGLRNTG